MRTGRYNLISVGSIWLTSTGLSNGSPCKTSVTGLDALSFNYTGNTQFALDGTPYNQILENSKKGLPLSIKIEATTDTRLNELKSALATLFASGNAVTVKITGSAGSNTNTGDFLLTCLPLFPKPLEFSGDFQSGYVRDITLNFVVKQDNALLTATAAALTLTGASATLTQA